MHKRYMDLQKRCKKYYMKIYIRYALVVVLALLVLAIVLMSLFNQSKHETKVIEQKVVEPLQTKQTKEIEQVEAEQKLQDKKESTDTPKLSESVTEQTKDEQIDEIVVETVVEDSVTYQVPYRLEPVYNFEIDELLQSLTPSQKTEETPKEVKQEPKSVEKVQEVKEVKKQTAPLVQKGLIHPREIEDIEQKIAIFNQRPHYDRAYGIAYEYFLMQEYEKTIEWLQKADSLNSAQEKVFELYAKALYKLGKNTQAISLLNYYLQLKVSHRLEALKKLIEENSL